MRKLFKITACVSFAIIGAYAAVASPVPQLETYFGRKMTQFQTSLDKYNSTAAANDQTLAFQDLQIWIAPEVTIGINSVLKLTISPEIDFVLTPPVK